MQKLNVAVLFGGRSGEHEVSLLSAASIMRALDRERYNVIPVGITRHGAWIVGADPWTALQREDLSGTEGAALFGDPTRPGLWRVTLEGDTARLELLQQVDVVFPVLHGTYGEDGTLQGLLELAAVPYVGCGVLASAVAMDKALFKDVCCAWHLPIVPYVLVTRARWQTEGEALLDSLEAQLPYPVFVKPVNLGSSVGISKCRTREELRRGLDEAARYDRRLLVEQAVPKAREIEVSVLGNGDAISASIAGEIIPGREFYDYAAKYLDDGENASKLLIPARLDEAQMEQVRMLAITAFRAVDGAGMGRVDFLMNGETGELFINEINTIPGFTAISMYPKLWEASGLPYPRLLDRLIELAFERHAETAALERIYRPERG